MNINNNIREPSFNIVGLPDLSIISEIGKFIKHHRLRQNMTQQELSEHAGVDRITLSKIENGDPFSLLTLIKIIRSLGLLESIMDAFSIPHVISPSSYLKMQQKERKRARHTTKK